MSLRIQTNVEAFSAHRHLLDTASMLSKSMERLSSGFRINRAADDAAGLTISEKLRSQINGLEQAEHNARDALSLVQTAEGALGEVHAMLQRLRDLAVQYNNGTLSSSDQAAITAEVTQLSAEISRIGSATQFNSISLLTAANATTTITVQVGALDGETLSFTVPQLFGSGSAYVVDLNVFDFVPGGKVTLASIDVAIAAVSGARATFGAAVENRLEHTLNNLAAYQENLVSSESRIRDADMAAEMVEYTKLQILQQAGTSMLAQANTSPRAVLALLR
jgi:flagellin